MVGQDVNCIFYYLWFIVKNVFNIHGIDKESLDGCIVSSVVPSLTTAFKKACGLLKIKETLFVGPGVKTGLDIKIEMEAFGSTLAC